MRMRFCINRITQQVNLSHYVACAYEKPCIYVIPALHKMVTSFGDRHAAILGHWPFHHANGLRQLAFEHLLKVQKLKQLVKQSVSITTADDINIASSEYPTYLKAAYKADKIPDKPKIMGLIDKDIPAAQMEKLMLANLKVSADDLRDLTIKHAQAAKEYLLKTDAIDPTRIFITTAKTGTDEQKKLPDNRVDFILGSH